MSERPFSVSEYSTRGGISAYIRRLISLSSSSIFSVDDKTFGEISGIARPIELKRVLSFSDSTHRIRIDHLPENRAITLRIGQCSIFVYFPKFSVLSNLFICSFTYSKVSGFQQRNLLFE